MKAAVLPGFLVLTLLAAAVPLSAHHQWPVTRTKLVTVKGTVTDFVWSNPHPMITVTVQARPNRQPTIECITTSVDVHWLPTIEAVEEQPKWPRDVGNGRHPVPR